MLQIYGTGEQTRSFQYVSDLVDGLVALMNSNYSQPVNLGNPDEYTISQFAVEIKKRVGRWLFIGIINKGVFSLSNFPSAKHLIFLVMEFLQNSEPEVFHSNMNSKHCVIHLQVCCLVNFCQ